MSKKLICCIGDSLTEGDYGVLNMSGIANVKEKNYPYFLSELTGDEVKNFGHCGFTSCMILDYFKKGYIDVTGANIIIILLGTNGGQTPEGNSENDKAYLEIVNLCRTQAPNAKIYLCTPPHVTENPNRSGYGCIEKVKNAVSFVKKISSELHLPLIDLFAEESFKEENIDVMQPNDGVHFSEVGYRTLADIIYSHLNLYDFSKLDARLSKYVYEDKNVSGLSIAVLKDNQMVFDRNYGLANIEKNYPVTDSTIFRLASMTKPVTGVAVMICKDLGLLDTNDYIDKYIPFLNAFFVRDINGNVIDNKPYRLKIDNLMRHTSGLQSGPLGEKETLMLNKSDYTSLEDIMYKYENFSLEYVPGSTVTYSATTTFDILARIVEIVSHMKYEDFLKKYIFDPLGMTHTTYSFDGIKEEQLAVSYTKVDDKLVAPKELESGFDYHPFGFPSGGAGLLSTKEDYVKFAQMLTNGGIYNGKRILSEEAFKDMTSHSKTDPIYLFGLSVYVRKGEDWEHLPKSFFGWSGAFGPHFFCSKKYGITVVYMHNSHSFGGAGAEHCNQLEDDICEIFDLKK